MNSVCKDCTLRIVGCHTICEQYLEEVKKNNERRERNMKQYRIDDTLADMHRASKRNKRSVHIPSKCHMK